MGRKVPPLNPLRSFEAAARHNSFARAAAELSVTPAAISRQVKLLEGYFGVEFFGREPGGVELTPEARAYANALSKAFDLMARATDEFRTKHTSSILSIRGYTTFLVKWLVPRLPSFQRLHPQIRVRLVGLGIGESVRGDADVVIRYGGTSWPGYRATHLFDDELVPVLSPGMLKSVRARGRLLTPARIAELPLLALEARKQDWADWFQQAGEAAARPRMQFFEDLAVLLEFARRGLGIALAQRAYITDELGAGSLIEVSRTVLRRDQGYYALASKEAAEKAKVSAFFDWLDTLAAEPLQANQK